MRDNSMSIFDFWVYLTDPVERLRRAQGKTALAHYEAAKPSPVRKRRSDNRAPNALVQQGAAAIRAQARYLERNHDIFRGALRVLVNNTIGPTGIGVEPQPRRKDGSINTAYAEELSAAYKRHCRRPEVTRRLSESLSQRMVGYTWFRDGECFSQQVFGDVPYLTHGSPVPFSVELFEPDFVPLDYNDPGRRITQGIQTNAWGQPVAYNVYKNDPREGGSWLTQSDLKSVPAERVCHVATFDRLHQLRGVSEAASVLTRAEDLKDYEESERVAAKIAASLTAYVKRTAPDGYDGEGGARDSDGNPLPRDIRMQPGMIIDSLLVGEEISLLDSKRPNPNLVAWRSGQLKAFAAGIGGSYSSISRNYDGTYSSQRQELVEQFVHYAVLSDEFVGMYVQPNYERFVEIAHLSGVVRKPIDLKPGTEAEALYLGQSMPWIDPLKEALAWEKRTQAGFASEAQAIRAGGNSPRDLLEQVSEFRAEADRRGLVFTSNARNVGGGAPGMQEPQNNQDDLPRQNA